MKKQIRWVIQNNLLAENDIKQLQKACNTIGVDFQEVDVIPFSEEPPTFTLDEKENIYYGSINFINNIYTKLNKPLGIFFNDNFSMENYIKIWGKKMLNSGAKITTFNKFTKETHDPKALFFIRPDADDKSFAGDVMAFGDICDWSVNITRSDSSYLDGNTKIIVGEAYNVKKEWRNYIVDGKVVASTKYRQNFRLKKCSEDIPKEMLDFTQRMIDIYEPHEIFAMDIALCGDEYYIIECGAMNSVGFYAASIEDIVTAITEYVDNNPAYDSNELF